MPTEVTDPALLAQLNAASAPTAPAPPGQEVTDPGLLAQLNAGSAPAALLPTTPTGVVGDVALTAGSGYLKSVIGAVNDLLPDWPAGSRATVQQQINTDPALNYQPHTAGGQAVVNTLGQVVRPIGAMLGNLKQKLAAVTSPRTAQVVGDVATLMGARVGAGIGRDVVDSTTTKAADAATAARETAPTLRPATPDVPGAGAATPPTFDTAAPGARPTPAAPAAEAPPPPGAQPNAAAPAAEGAAAPAAEGASAVPAAAQVQRAATLKNVGLTEARESAITGDKGTAATDYQSSKLDTEGGQAAAATFANERDTLGTYADNLVADSGGSAGLDETSLHNRGQTILQPLTDLRDNLNTRISSLYQRADAQAQGVPLSMDSTSNILQGNKSAFTGTMEGNQLLRGINGRLREMGVLDDDGSIGSATVQQAEQLKQYLNNQWSPRTSRLIGSLKDAVDDDVTRTAGGDIYQAARAARAQRAALLDNPQGVSSLLDASGPEGINRAVAVERVPDAVARMPVDQFGHVVDTLNQMPAELQPQAQAALGEIRSQFALRLQEQAQKLKGAWNNRGVTQYLNSNSAKLARVFSPSELQRMRTLNDAGNILDVDRSYPGAAVQGQNLIQRGAMAAVKHGGGVIGAHIGGPLGAGAGEFVGGRVASAIERSASKAAWRKRVRKL